MTDYRPMVEPQYGQWEGPDPIALHGAVLAFGAGQLVHETRLFDFTHVDRLVTYDPFVSLDVDRLEESLRARTTNTDRWETILESTPKRSFDVILCIFSLHYEPRWLATLIEMLSLLRLGGKLYFCEDAGFRAVLDGNIEGTRKFASIDAAFHDRLTTEIAAPWIPDFSASDASLLQEVLSVFGETRQLQTASVTRTPFPEAEPDCYLPWNPDRNPIPADLIARVRTAIAQEKTIEERIELFEFTLAPGGAVPDVFDLSDPRARIIWRALADRAARAVGRLIVSRTGARMTHNDLPFRRAALSILYQNVLRQFSFWRAVELVVGALNPEFGHSAEADPSQYEFTCVAPADTPRFWGAKFGLPDFLGEYRDRLSKAKSGWVGEALYERGRGGVYLWGARPSPGEGDEPWTTIDQTQDLYSDFSTRETPPCVYIVDPLATRDRFVVSSENHILYGALIIYLRDVKDGELARELRCLLFVLESSRAIVVGRAGFLELELLQENARNSEAIQEPLRQLRENREALRATANAVELLASRLDPSFESPGLVHLEAIRGAFAEMSLFGGRFHSHQVQTPARLVEARLAASVDKSIAGLLSELEAHGVDHVAAKLLFEPLSVENAIHATGRAAAFAKTLTRTDALPLTWIAAAFKEIKNAAADLERFYLNFMPAFLQYEEASAQNSVNVFLAFYNARVEVRNAECRMEGSSLSCDWTILPDPRGDEGLEYLRKFLAGEKVDVRRQGLTSRSLSRILRFCDQSTKRVELSGSLMVHAEFPLKQL